MAYEWLDKIRELLPAGKRETTYDEVPNPIPPSQRDSASTSTATQWDAWLRVIRNGIPIAMFAVGAILSLFTELIDIWAIFGYVLVASSPVVYFLLRIEQRLVELRESIQRLPTSAGTKPVSRSSNFSKYD